MTRCSKTGMMWRLGLGLTLLGMSLGVPLVVATARAGDGVEAAAAVQRDSTITQDAAPKRRCGEGAQIADRRNEHRLASDAACRLATAVAVSIRSNPGIF